MLQIFSLSLVLLDNKMCRKMLKTIPTTFVYKPPPWSLLGSTVQLCLMERLRVMHWNSVLNQQSIYQHSADLVICIILYTLGIALPLFAF